MFWAGHVPPQHYPFTCGDLDPHLIHGSLGPPEFTPQTTSWSVQPFRRAHDRDRPTDRQTTLLRL